MSPIDRWTRLERLPSLESRPSGLTEHEEVKDTLQHGRSSSSAASKPLWVKRVWELAIANSADLLTESHNHDNLYREWYD